MEKFAFSCRMKDSNFIEMFLFSKVLHGTDLNENENRSNINLNVKVTLNKSNRSKVFSGVCTKGKSPLIVVTQFNFSKLRQILSRQHSMTMFNVRSFKLSFSFSFDEGFAACSIVSFKKHACSLVNRSHFLLLTRSMFYSSGVMWRKQKLMFHS